MSLPELKSVPTFSGIPGPGAKNQRVVEEYILVRDDSPASQTICFVTMMAYSLAGKGHRGACAFIRFGTVIGDKVITHDGAYNVGGVSPSDWMNLKTILTGLKQFVEVTKFDGRRNQEYKSMLYAVHKNLLAGLRDTGWWLAGYAKRRGGSLKWGHHFIAKWRIPSGKHAEVREIERQKIAAKQERHEKFGWLDESVPVVESKRGLGAE